MTKKILVLLSHPKLENSRVHKALLNEIKLLSNVTVQDLYEEYPNFNIDIKKEQQLLLNHDIIIWQHPMYWYSCPPIMKQWIDLVLSFGWAYGTAEKALKGKTIFNALSTGGAEISYSKEGRNGHPIADFLLPFSQTAKLCEINYLPPFVVHGTHTLDKPDIDILAKKYKLVLEKISSEDFLVSELENLTQLNSLIIS